MALHSGAPWIAKLVYKPHAYYGYKYYAKVIKVVSTNLAIFGRPHIVSSFIHHVFAANSPRVLQMKSLHEFYQTILPMMASMPGR